MTLHRDGVFVIYEWKWTDETTHEYDTVSPSLTSTPQSSPPLSPSLLPIANAPVTSTPMVTHIVTFKCIGAVRDERKQRALQLAFEARKKGEVVGVKIEPEPRNPYDARAIAFLCMVEGSWQRIGYIVRELLEEVHAAISAHDILWVKFAWVNYLLQWTRSGPGFYAGTLLDMGNGPIHAQCLLVQKSYDISIEVFMCTCCEVW